MERFILAESDFFIAFSTAFLAVGSFKPSEQSAEIASRRIGFIGIEEESKLTLFQSLKTMQFMITI